MVKAILFVSFFAVSSISTLAQVTPAPQPAYADPMTNMSYEMTRISAQVLSLTKAMETFVDKFEKVGGTYFNEKQQRLVLGMEFLVRSEQRVATLQKSQADLTEKLNATRSRLSQVEIELRPRNVTNSTTFAGTTETEELRDSMRRRLENERNDLSLLLPQLQENLSETTAVLREARALADRLRKNLLPQLEREVYDRR